MTDDRKVCFIICVNDEKYAAECQIYIDSLHVPQGYVTDVISVTNAKSMAAGYNAAMMESDARYKVYLQQDTFIRNRNFIQDILNIFVEQDIGMIGMVGTPKLSNDGVIWHGVRCGSFQNINRLLEKDLIQDFQLINETYQQVEAVDGLLIATQYDLSWREDFFDGWDFYDVSQCGEFRKKGYRIVVAGQPGRSWVIHDAGIPGLLNYEKYRKIFLKEYASLFHLEIDKKRILYPFFDEFRMYDIPWAIMNLKQEVAMVEEDCSLTSADPADWERMSHRLLQQNADMVMTHDYSPLVSAACNEYDIPYLAWIYDSPQKALYDPTIHNPCNYIFSFDKKQVEQIRNMGVTHVYHMPLAANVDRIGSLVISAEDEKKYCCNVSFIGQLYRNEMYDKVLQKGRMKTRREIEKALDCTVGRWDGVNHYSGSLSDESLQDLNRIFEGNAANRTDIGDRIYYETMIIAHEAAYRERTRMLQMLIPYGIRFHTHDAVNEIPGVEKRPVVDYVKELPKLYYLSKINLNCTLPSIESGVPLRVFDIMGSGGFMLSNAQPEIQELFHIGKELDVFHDFEEMVDKVKFYLAHEDIRLRIAMRGYETVRNHFSYEKQVQKMLQIVQEDLNMKEQGRT